MKVDIIIPAYTGVFLAETLDSCVNQSYKDFRITVINNDSKIDIEKICKQFSGINYIKSDANLGPGGGRNLGIKSTINPLISFIDDDDVMHKDKLLNSVGEFKGNVGMTCGNYQIMINGVLRKPFYSKPIHVDYKSLFKVNLVASGSTTIRRDVLNTIGLFNEKYWIAEDYDLWLRCSEEYSIKYIDKILYHYRILPAGNSLTQRKDIQADHIKNITEIKNKSLERINGKFNKWF